MALTVIGVAGSMDTLGFNALMRDVAAAPAGNDGMYVPTGLTASAGSGTRNVLVSPGRSVQAGTLATLDDASPGRLVNFPANTSGLPRIDLLCLQVDLRLAATTAGSLVVVQGTPRATPIVPVPTSQNTRTIWQTPLAQYTVANGATVPTNFIDRRPGADRGFIPALISGTTWALDSPQLGVQRVGDLLEMNGAILRSGGGSLASGDTATFGGNPVLPEGYTPRRPLVVRGISGTAVNDISEQRFIFQTDGTCILTVTRGTLAINRVIRVDTTTFMGA